MCNRIAAKLGLERREMLHQQRRQESILAQREQILLVQRVNIRLCVLVDDAVGDDDGPPLVRRPDTIQTETTGQASDGAEQTLKRLGQMVRDVVFVDLNHRPPRLVLVGDLCLATDTDNARVVGGRGNQSVKSVGGDGLEQSVSDVSGDKQVCTPYLHRQ